MGVRLATRGVSSPQRLGVDGGPEMGSHSQLSLFIGHFLGQLTLFNANGVTRQQRNGWERVEIVGPRAVWLR